MTVNLHYKIDLDLLLKINCDYDNDNDNRLKLDDMLQIIIKTQTIRQVLFVLEPPLTVDIFENIVTHIIKNKGIIAISLMGKPSLNKTIDFMNRVIHLLDNSNIKAISIFIKLIDDDLIWINKIWEMNILKNFVIGFNDSYDHDKLTVMLENNYYITQYKNFSIKESDHLDRIEKLLFRNQCLTRKSFHPHLLDCTIVLIQAKLPVYVILEIFDWTIPYIHMFYHVYKIHLIQKVYDWYNSRSVI